MKDDFLYCDITYKLGVPQRAWEEAVVTITTTSHLKSPGWWVARLIVCDSGSLAVIGLNPVKKRLLHYHTVFESAVQSILKTTLFDMFVN